MKISKKIFSMIMTLLLVVGIVPISTLTAFAAVGDTFTVDSIEYKITSESEYTVTVNDGTNVTGNCTIPTSVNYQGVTYYVTEIGQDAFKWNGALTNIIIPDGITRINSGTFQYYGQLSSVTLPDSLTSIGSYAFDHCLRLTDITIPENVTSIETLAFGDCQKLNSITIPANVTNVGSFAFRRCTSLETVLFIVDDPKTIGNYVFDEISPTITYKYADPSDLRWEGTTLKWDGLGTGYVQYEVKINPISTDSGIRPIATTVYTTDHYYDFSGYISPGTYTVRVTAVLPEMIDIDEPDYQSSESVTLEEQRVPPRIEISNIYPVRAGVDSANISFVASMPGTMYYFVTDLIQQNPHIDTSGEGMAIKEGYNLFHPTLNAAIDPTQWQYVYVTFKTADGVLSEITRIDVVGTSRTTHRLTVTADEGGNIDPGSRYVEDGGSITFTITPNSGYKLDTLTLDGADVTSAVVGNQYTLINVTAAHTVQVSFTPVSCICDTKCTDTANAGCPVCSANAAVLSEVCKGQETQATTYSVSVSKDGSGAITGEGSYAPGEQVTITATPDTANGYCTAGWGLSAVGGGVISPIERKTSHTFTMPEKDVAIAITFVPHSYISHTNNGNGTHDVHCIYCGDIQTASESCVDAHGGGGDATPDGWCDKCDAAMIYTITVQADGNGTSYASLATATAGTQITLTATPNTGYHFKEWQVVSGSVTITNNQFNMPIGDVTVKAVFEQDAPSTYTVTVQNDGNGTASASPATAAAGTQIVLTSTANSGYHFKEWQVVFGNVSIVNNAFQMPSENVTIKAIFEQDAPTTYTITFNFNDGTAQTTTAQTGTDGKLASLPVLTRTGYIFCGWYATADGQAEITTDTVFTTNATVYAKWMLCDHAGSTNQTDCTNAATCSLCGGNMAALGHDFVNGPWINTDPAGHYRKCVRCDVTDIVNMGAHVYDDEADMGCNTCGYVRTPTSYEIIEGAEQTVTLGRDATFTSNAACSKYVKTQVDGKDVPAEYCTVFEGSTKVTLSAAYIRTLSIGEHTLTIVSSDGSASTKFTVKAPPLTINSQPQDQYVVEGQTATFTIEAQGDGVTYQWYINRNDGRGWRLINGATSPLHTTKTTDLDCDGFKYGCIVTDMYGNQVQSDVAILHVSAVPVLPETGDHSHPILYLGLLLMSCVGMIVIWKKRVKA